LRRVLKALALILTVLAGGLVAAWYSGQVEEAIIESAIRAPGEANRKRQLVTPPGYPGRRPVAMAAFEAKLDALGADRQHQLDDFLAAATIPDIQARLDEGTLTSVELTLHLLDRIRRYDERLQSVSEIDPNVLETARELDAERAAGRIRGPMHGIPVLLKDNISTAGALHTTAGAAALRDLQTGIDAPLVRNLREAGALIFGKGAMSEWANFTSSTLPNGFSALGGQVRNPYGAFDVSGSSSGSAVAVASGLVTVSVGSETWGSLVSPASQNAVVTIKPSFGLVSNEGMIPVVPSRDTAGPIARSVSDAAILLDALSGAAGMPYGKALRENGLSGLRLGVVSVRGEMTEGDDLVLSRALDAIEKAGGKVVRLAPSSLLDARFEVQDFGVLANHGFVRGVDAFLAGTSSEVRTLAEVIAFNEEDLVKRAPFGQDLLVGSMESTATDADVEETKAQSELRARETIGAWLEEGEADLLIAIGSAFNVPFCAAGYPALNVPAGARPTGEPVGLTFVGRAGDEALLIRAAFAFEQQTRARTAPDLASTFPTSNAE
jgi:amidase